MTTSFFLDVSHSQVAVFNSSLDEPFNDWTEKHVRQGFAWRPGSVSFATMKEAGGHLVTIEIASANIDLPPDANRIIQTPFDVSNEGAIEVASISSRVAFSLLSGSYQLRFEYYDAAANAEARIRFMFIKTRTPSFGILRADQGLSAKGDDLLLTANPA